MNDWQTTQNQARGRIQILFVSLMGGYLIMVLGVLWWGVWQGDALLTREDNPRQVEAELRIQRGQIVDSNGVVLAENSGTLERQSRIYHYPLAEPAIGYYSLRYGTSGVEESLDTVLRGETADGQILMERELFHRPQVGQNVRLSLDIALQTAVTEQMAGHTGAAVLLFLPRGGDQAESLALVRALVSLPSYDPNQLDELFDTLVVDESGPLLNRATQAQYQPGQVLLPFLLASAAEQHGELFDMAAATQDPTQLATLWDNEELTAVWESWGLTSAPQFSLPTAETGPTLLEIREIEKELMGEGSLLVTPLQVALATAALVRDGVLPKPRLITAVETEGRWINYESSYTSPPPIISANVASTIRSNLFISHPQLTNGNTIYTSTVSAGEDRYNHWFIGLTPNQTSRYIMIIIQESTTQESNFLPIFTHLLNNVSNRN